MEGVDASRRVVEAPKAVGGDRVSVRDLDRPLDGLDPRESRAARAGGEQPLGRLLAVAVLRRVVREDCEQR